MTEWIDFAEEKPKESCLCWVMNCRRGAYGFVALWQNDRQYFEQQAGASHLNPALEVTHWIPLPWPEYIDTLKRVKQ